MHLMAQIGMQKGIKAWRNSRSDNQLRWLEEKIEGERGIWNPEFRKMYPIHCFIIYC
jgi:hypothetical protein